MPTFRSPSVFRRVGKPEALWWVGVEQSKTVVKYGDTWKTVMSPSEDFLAACSVVLRGGYVTKISDALASELTAAGYGAYVEA